MIFYLKIGTVIAFAISMISLGVLMRNTFACGVRKLYAEPQGSEAKGIFYALGRGMMPWEKESAKKHLPTYFGGVCYHIGIFAAFFYLLLLMLTIPTPGILLLLLQLATAAGSLCGIALLFKRMIAPKLRAISNVDDFVSNLLATAFVILALLHMRGIDVIVYLYVAAIVTFLYIPVGKLRHCAFFFMVRVLFGKFFGRRNVVPPASQKV
jgi:nitrate reductase gamma subunit